MSLFIDIVRGAAAGTVVAHVLSRVLCSVGKILYEIMLEGFLCLTKPSKRAVRGAVLLTPASMQGCFCAVRLAAHVSNGLKSRIRPVVGRI